MIGFSNPEDDARARDVFQRADYNYDGVCRTLGDPDWVTLKAIDLPRFARRVRAPAPQHTLIRLLLLGDDVPLEAVRRALAPLTPETWIAAGILRPPTLADQIRSGLRLVPVEDLLLAADNPLLDAREAPADFVMSPGGTSLQLGWSAIQRPSRRTFDLGTGCGYLGLRAAAFSDRVMATDRNERAVELTRFNARLNGVAHLDSAAGDLWEPVRGERFDLVLSNPPFVIAPQPRLLFRDSGLRGDEFCRRLIREVPAYLEEGGFCQMLANVAQRRDQSCREALSDWFADLGCDALVFVTRQQTIDEYALSWITSTESQDPTVVPRLYDEWMDYYESQQLAHVSYLLINLRRRNSVSNWTYVEDEAVQVAGACGEAILRRFAVLDQLADLPDDDALLEWYLELDPQARLVQEHVMTADGPGVAGNRLEMRGPLRYAAQLDVNVLRLLVHCDGRQPLRVLLDGLAQSLGADPQRVARIALPVVRHLLQRGFLIPGPDSPAACAAPVLRSS